VNGKANTKDKSERPKAEEKQAFFEMCRGMMSGEMPECCRPMMQTMMSRWASAFSPPKQG
jgi:hypothetical protein